MGKKKSWFTYVTRLFISEPKAVKKWKNSRSLFKSKCYLAIENPSTALNDPAEQERGKHAVAIATAAVAAAEAAIAAANAAAEVARITNLSHELRRKNLHSAAIKIQSYYKGYLARKALSALKGVVKLQAVVRGELARTRIIKKLARISPRELRLQRSRIIQENSTPATIGTTKLAQLKLRNAIKHAQNEDSTPPFTHGRRSFCHVNDRSAGNGDYNDGYNNLSLNKAQAFPAYMATTESAKAKAKAKARSSSTPKQRRRLSDSYSCQDSPSNLSISSWSSFNSELIQHSKSVIANGTRRL